MWPDDKKTSIIIENIEHETLCVNLWKEQQDISKNVGKNLTQKIHIL